MPNNGLFDRLEEVLLTYHERDQSFYIKLTDILDWIEFQILSSNYESTADVRQRLSLVMDGCFKKLTPAYAFGVMSTIHFIDTYFERQEMYQGLHVLAATEDPSISGGYFNSADARQMASEDYFFNLRECRLCWQELSFRCRDYVERLCFEPPVKEPVRKI
jgi:hypothetical protein